ncbi:MAG: ABC transporter permease [Acidobacteriota bacterium]|jgi:putative ABC transport system permease protein
METFLEDLRFSMRALRRKPLFAAVAVITLALGIGANTAMYSVIEAAFVRPLPYPQPERLVRIYSTFQGRVCCPLSAPNFLDVRARQTSFEDVVAYGTIAVAVTGDGDPVRVAGYQVSDGLFELLGATPQIGRFITEEDNRFGAEPVVVLSDEMWRERFGGDPGVLGRTMVIDSVPHTIIGVAPPEFRVTGTPQLFVPFAWDPENMPSRGSNSYIALARLRDGVNLDAAMEEVESIYADLVREYPDQIANDGVAALTLDEWLIGASRRRPLLILWGAVAMVLLVACANVVNLMLARAETRQRELAVRAAMGAPRGRLVLHFLSESIVVSLTGALLGVVAAAVGLRLLLARFGNAIPRSSVVGIDLGVLLFALAAGLLTGIGVGLVPALQTRPARLYGALREGARGTTGGQTVLRQGLVVFEIGAALVLVVGAGLMLKSFWRLSQVDVGVDASHMISARVSLPSARYDDTATVLGFWDSFLAELERLPTVESASLASAVPFTGTYNNFSRVTPANEPEREATFVESRVVSLGFFDTMGLALQQGRNFNSADNDDAPAVVIINRELARQIFPEDDAVGATITPGPGSDGWQVIGVVENHLEHGPDRPPAPTVYFSYVQATRTSMAFTVRTSGDPLDIVPDFRRIARQLDPDLPVYEVFTLDQLLYRGTGSRRFNMSLLSTFAGLALLLGAVGIYGVMAYSVEQRTREIGMRQALGATRSRVLTQVVTQGIKLAAIGVALGTAGAFALRGTLASMLFEVGSFDGPVYAAVALVLVAVATLACLIPARRAAAIDPMIALRDE